MIDQTSWKHADKAVRAPFANFLNAPWIAATDNCFVLAFAMAQGQVFSLAAPKSPDLKFMQRGYAQVGDKV